MPVYVDNARAQYGRMIMCHMTADTHDELHAMAAAIGVARRWFQCPPKVRFPHYDVCLKSRARAVALGAREVDSREVVRIARRLRGA